MTAAEQVAVLDQALRVLEVSMAALREQSCEIDTDVARVLSDHVIGPLMDLRAALQAERARIAAEANAARSEKAKAQIAEQERDESGRVKPGGSTNSATTRTPEKRTGHEKGAAAKAAASGTNRGAVQRGDKLKALAADLDMPVRSASARPRVQRHICASRPDMPISSPSRRRPAAPPPGRRRGRPATRPAEASARRASERQAPIAHEPRFTSMFWWDGVPDRRRG